MASPSAPLATVSSYPDHLTVSISILTLLGMNNFIVGQVTPDMISGMRYGKFSQFFVIYQNLF
jgi:hypothetical protein